MQDMQDMQDKEMYDNLSSPTAATASVLSIAALAAHERRGEGVFEIKYTPSPLLASCSQSEMLPKYPCNPTTTKPNQIQLTLSLSLPRGARTPNSFPQSMLTIFAH